MTNILQDFFPSKYFKAQDLPENEDLIVTIEKFGDEIVGQGADAASKPIIYFKEVPDKPLVLNRTNATTIANLYGSNPYHWPGKKIALFATEVTYGGKVMLGIRVRIRPPAGVPAGAPQRVIENNPPMPEEPPDEIYYQD